MIDSTTILATLAILILLFLALREFNCWYLKTNEILSIQKQQIILFQKLVDQIGNKSPLETTLQIPNIYDSANGYDKIIQVTEDDIRTVNELKVFMDKGKNWFNGGEQVPNIVDLLEKVCKTENECQRIIKAYENKYNSDLITDLKKLYTSYEVQKQITNVFLVHGVLTNP